MIDSNADNLFPGGELPRPESLLRRRVVQSVALVAIAASLVYLGWRLTNTLGADLWIAIPLWLLELHAVVGLGLFTFSLWNLDAQPVPEPVEATDASVAVLIPTYNEPREILFPVVAAAVGLQPSHRTVVLDDGHRKWVQEMAVSLGAEYLTREERAHAKAGNLNHAIASLDVDIIAVLDADHIARSGLLTHTLGYFADPRVAVVQTPQDFYNQDSFEHDRNRSLFWRERQSIPFSEQRLFYRALQAGKNRWQAAFWCGTNALIRVSALREVGGVAQESVTEDMHTTIRLHRRGWRTVYHNEVLAHGLAARNAAEYQTQRLRWGTGAMQILRLERPLTGSGLGLGQRIAYGATLLGWFDAWRTLGYVVLPLAVMFSGAMPIRAGAVVFVIAFGLTFTLQRLALALLSRGYAPQGLAVLFEFVRMQSNIHATLMLLRRRERPFRVTDKAGGRERRRIEAPWSLWALIGLTVLALVWFAATLAQLTPTAYGVRWAAYGAAFWSVVNLGFLVGALRRIRSERFASERRAAFRLEVAAEAEIDGRPAQLIDVSIGGALARCSSPPGPSDLPLLVSFRFGGHDVSLLASERGRQELIGGDVLLRLQFADGQVAGLATLTRALFGGEVIDTREPERELAAA